MITTLIMLALWTISSFVWFFCSIGRKYGKNRWYDYLLYPPFMIIVTMIVWVSTKLGLNK
jgi:hypothetical protein